MIWRATPRATSIMPSVAMKGGSRIRVTMKPLRRPQSVPVTMAGEHAEGNRKPEIADAEGGRHAGQREHRSDREVDAPGDDDEGGADAEQTDRGDLQRDGHAVVDAEERRTRQREHGDQGEETAERGEFLDDVPLALASAGRRSGRGSRSRACHARPSKPEA